MPEVLNDYANTLRTAEEQKPQAETFVADGIYSDAEVALDQEILDIVENHPAYSPDHDPNTPSARLENILAVTVARDDWLRDGDRFADDPSARSFGTVSTSEIDDHFNHIDTIAVIANRFTGGAPVPIGIDLTTQKNPRKLAQKFGHRHTWGLKPSVEENISEFGVPSSEFWDGEQITSTMDVSPRDKNGLGIPGFASAKYFEDINAPSAETALPKGRIPVMPRLIVGFDGPLTKALAGGAPNKADWVINKGRKAYENRLREYESAELQARYIMLSELTSQSAQIGAYLDALPPSKKRFMDPAELKAARLQISAVHDYFADALSRYELEANGDPEQGLPANPKMQTAMERAKADPVYEALTSAAEDTYVRPLEKFQQESRQNGSRNGNHSRNGNYSRGYDNRRDQQRRFGSAAYDAARRSA